MLDRALVEEVLVAARTRGGAFAEVFVEEATGTSIRLDDGKVEELTTGLDRGAGVRVTHGTSYGYAFSNRLDREALLQAADAASAALRDGEAGSVVDLRTLEGPVTNAVERDAAGVPASDKVAWLRELDDAARAYSPEVTQVVGMYGDSLQRRLIATSDGRWVTEDRPRIRLVAQVVAKRGDVIQTGFHGPAACAGVEFIDAHPPRATAEVAAKRAVTMLDSVPAPAGEMTVVLAPGMGGVLFHEAVGHPLEADAVDKEASVYRGLVGTACASELINGVDDATIANGWGSFAFDDEANACSANGAVHRRRAAVLPVRPVACRQGRRRVDRQRAPAVVRVAPGGPHDEHQHPERFELAGRGARRHVQRGLRDVARRRPGESGDG